MLAVCLQVLLVVTFLKVSNYKVIHQYNFHVLPWYKKGRVSVIINNQYRAVLY